METLNQIQSLLGNHRNSLFQKYGIRNLAIFGSYARSEQNENSDIDIMVEFNRPVGMEFIELAEDLENILHKNVDLVSKNGIKPKYYKSIENDLNYV